MLGLILTFVLTQINLAGDPRPVVIVAGDTAKPIPNSTAGSGLNDVTECGAVRPTKEMVPLS